MSYYISASLSDLFHSIWQSLGPSINGSISFNENFNLPLLPIPFSFFLVVSLHAGSFLIGYSSLKEKFSNIRNLQKVCTEERTPLNHVPAQQEFSWHKGYVDGFLQLLLLRGTGGCRSAHISESIFSILPQKQSASCIYGMSELFLFQLCLYLLLFHNKSGWGEASLPIHILYSLVSNESLGFSPKLIVQVYLVDIFWGL